MPFEPSSSTKPSTASIPDAPSLAQCINARTHHTHRELNTLILSFLPLALPPYATDPRPYLGGMRCIYEIYAAFEDVSAASRRTPPTVQALQDQRVQETLRQMHIPALERKWRLAKDIDRLTDHETRKHRQQRFPPFLSHPFRRKTDTDLAAHTQLTMQDKPRLAGLISHIHNDIPQHPHLLFAYQHLFYLALFNGGRHIRAKLKDAGCRFWCHPRTDEHNHHAFPPPCEDDDEIESRLSFWSFEGDEEEAEDGADLKAEYKRRWSQVDTVLTQDAKDEVLREATYVMAQMVLIVREISEVVGRESPGRAASGLDKERWPSAQSFIYNDLGHMAAISTTMLLLKHVLPIGIMELALALWNVAVCALGARSAHG
ncbi:MAG: hypothetical protein Q9163_006047 [Psora crenata]